jgi:hypothetical protein
MREPKKPKRDKTRKWCPGGNKNLGHISAKDRTRIIDDPDRYKKKFVRCEICNQRFEVYNVRDHGCCDMAKIPPHKAY